MLCKLCLSYVACALSVLLPANPLSSHLLDTVQIQTDLCTSGRSVYTYHAQVHLANSLYVLRFEGEGGGTLDQIHNILVGPNADILVLCGLNSMQSVVSTWCGRKSLGFWTYWFLLLNSRFYASESPETARWRKLPACPDDQIAVPEDSQEWSTAAVS